MVTCLVPTCVHVFVCRAGSLLGPQCPVEVLSCWGFFEQQVGEDGKSEDRRILQSERDDKRERRELVKILNHFNALCVQKKKCINTDEQAQGQQR